MLAVAGGVLAGIVGFAAIPLVSRAEPQTARTADFFPMAAWYGGGHARAPMLERDARSKKEIWRKDVQQIKALGFKQHGPTLFRRGYLTLCAYVTGEVALRRCGDLVDLLFNPTAEQIAASVRSWI